MKRFKNNPHNQTQKSGGRTMKKKVLSVVMAAAMMTSVFSATAVTASAADAETLKIISPIIPFPIFLCQIHCLVRRPIIIKIGRGILFIDGNPYTDTDRNTVFT